MEGHSLYVGNTLSDERSPRLFKRLPLVFAVMLSAAAIASSAAPDLPELRELDGDPIVTLLPPDGIPAIDKPRFAPASKSKFMQDGEPVVGVVHNGVAKAYSIWHLDRHEVVNDDFGGDPLAVTW